VWDEVANFVLTFESRAVASGTRENRITAHKMQEGGITEKWIGTEPQPMVQWIRDHLGDWAQAAVRTDPPIKVPRHELAAFRLEVSALCPIARASGDRGHEQAELAARQSDARIHVSGPATFDLEAVVQIDPSNADLLADGSVRCAVEFFSRNTLTAEKARLGEAMTAEVTATQRSYTAVLLNVTLNTGSHRLACVARLRNSAAPIACLQGPLIQVG
jgi:hypothetical protein